MAGYVEANVIPLPGAHTIKEKAALLAERSPEDQALACTAMSRNDQITYLRNHCSDRDRACIVKAIHHLEAVKTASFLPQRFEFPVARLIPPSIPMYGHITLDSTPR